jgi:hypothetical protein
MFNDLEERVDKWDASHTFQLPFGFNRYSTEYFFHKNLDGIQ